MIQRDMKALEPFIRKEFYHILRDRKTLLIVLVMPVVLVVLFGFAIRTELRDAPIAIFDQAHDELSTGLTHKLLSSGYFIKVKDLSRSADIEAVFKNGEAKMVIVFPPYFSRDFYHSQQASVQLLADASNINTATTLISYVQAIVDDYRQQALRFAGALPPFEFTVKMMYNPALEDVYMFVPGVLALVLMLVSAMMTSVSLAREKENGTFRLLTVSPLAVWKIIFGKVIPYLLLSLINTVVILVLSVFMLGMPMNGSLLTLFPVCLLFLFTALSLGILISSVAQTQQVAIFISIIGLFLPTVLLSGFIYPIENMPLPLQLFCQLFPAKWFIEAIKTVMIKSGGIADVWLQLVVLLGMTLLFLRLSVLRYSLKK